MNSMAQAKSAEFIAGYVFRSVERKFLSSVEDWALKKFPLDGVTHDFTIPKMWISGDLKADVGSPAFRHKCDDICEIISRVMQLYCKDKWALEIKWDTILGAPHHIIFQWTLNRRSAVKYTLSEIEALLGCRIEIVSEKVE